MKNFINYFGKFICILCILTIGIYLGTLLENYRTDLVNGNLQNNTKIALVNLDEGVDYQGEQRNFANELLGNYEEDYIMTGLNDAQSGIKEGRYAAYIILPSDFSNNIVTINNEPQKSLLKYEISGNLSQNATDKAWQNVMKLKEKLNDDIGYVYISSILGEFHSGQDNVSKVLANDKSDKEVLMAISNIDLVTTLDLTEVKRLQNEIEDLDVSSDYETNKQIIEAIDLAYKGYMEESDSQLTSLKNESSNIHQNLNPIQEKINASKTIFEEDNEENYHLENTLQVIDGLNLKVNDNISNLKNALHTVDENANNDTDLLKENVTKQINALVQKFNESHQTLYEDMKQKVISDFKDKLNYQIFEGPLQINVDEFMNTYKMIDDFVDNYNLIVNNYNLLVHNYNDLMNLRKDENNAEDILISKVISCLSVYDFTQTNSSFDDFLQFVEDTLNLDEEFKKSLYTYAISRGMEEEEALNYTIDMLLRNATIDYLTDNEEEDEIKLEEELDKQSVYQQIQTSLKQDIQPKRDNLKTMYDTFIECINQYTNSELSKQVIDNITAFHTYVSTLNATDTTNVLNAIQQFQNTGFINDSIFQQSIKEDLLPYYELQKETKNNLLEALNYHVQISNVFQDNLAMYDPIQTIKEYEIQSYVNEYNRNNTGTQHKVQQKNSEYLKFVSDSYQNANEHIQTMRTDIQKYQQESDKKVTTGLESAKKAKENTSASNISLMSSYLNKLTYTRNGSVANTLVYDFVTAPTDMEGEKALNSIEEDNVNIFIILIPIVLGSTCIWAVFYIILKKQVKNT